MSLSQNEQNYLNLLAIKSHRIPLGRRFRKYDLGKELGFNEALVDHIMETLVTGGLVRYGGTMAVVITEDGLHQVTAPDARRKL